MNTTSTTPAGAPKIKPEAAPAEVGQPVRPPEADSVRSPRPSDPTPTNRPIVVEE